MLEQLDLRPGEAVLVKSGSRHVLLASKLSDAFPQLCRIPSSVMDALQTRPGAVVEVARPGMVLGPDSDNWYGRIFTLDDFGNPKGVEFDLGGQDIQRRGGKILLYWTYDYRTTGENYVLEDAQTAVAQRGFAMTIIRRWQDGEPLSSRLLERYHQLWFATDRERHLADDELAAVERFVRSGHGLLIWADNDPYNADANLLATRIVGCRFQGNWMCDKLMRPSHELRPGFFTHHALTTGLESLYEGVTLPTIELGPNATAIAQAADGPINMAAVEHAGMRVVLDSGFTKLAEGKFNDTAGTPRYFRNVAYWLQELTWARQPRPARWRT
jgi:hypothetical protein